MERFCPHTGQVQLSVRSSCHAEVQSCAVGVLCAMAQCKLEPIEMDRGGTILMMKGCRS